MSPFELKNQNEIDALLLIHRCGYIRSYELGLLMRPKIKTSQKFAERLVRSMIKDKLIGSRTLDNGLGSVYYLYTRGARKLIEAGHKVEKVFKLDNFEGSQWLPPNDLQHHLMSISSAALLLKQINLTIDNVYFEREIRRNYPSLNKYPDFIIHTANNKCYWFEVENSAKTGGNADRLCELIEDITKRKYLDIFGKEVTQAFICFDPNAKDSRGCNLDHKGRIISKLQKKLEKTIFLGFLELKMKHLNVEAVILYKEQIKHDPMTGKFKELYDKFETSEGWYHHQDVSSSEDEIGVYLDEWCAYIIPKNGLYDWYISYLDIYGCKDITHYGTANSAYDCKIEIIKKLMILGLRSDNFLGWKLPEGLELA